MTDTEKGGSYRCPRCKQLYQGNVSGGAKRKCAVCGLGFKIPEVNV